MISRWLNVNSLDRQARQRASVDSIASDLAPPTSTARRAPADPGQAGRGKGAVRRPPTRHKTIWLSDVHLGTAESQAELLLDFLLHNESERLYLVGDIIDGWQLKRSFYWHDSHNEIVRLLLQRAQSGTKVVYIPGNHDDALRPYCGLNFGGIDVVFDAVHETVAGKRYLVIHGDYFDGVVKYARWIAILGDWTYIFALKMNRWLNIWRRWTGRSYWSLAAWLKRRAKLALEFMGDYQQAVVGEARKRGLDGVICGHIHCAESKTIDGIHYCNDGDWVESCTALTEDFSGKLQIIHWPTQMHIEINAPTKTSEGEFTVAAQ